jgi:hypothetical protein
VFGDGVETERALAILKDNGVSVSEGRDPTILKKPGVVQACFFYDSIPREQLEYLARKFSVSLALFYDRPSPG